MRGGGRKRERKRGVKFQSSDRRMTQRSVAEENNEKEKYAFKKKKNSREERALMADESSMKSESHEGPKIDEVS